MPSDTQSVLGPITATRTSDTVLDQILSAGKLAPDENRRPNAVRVVDAFVQKVLPKKVQGFEDGELSREINDCIAELDERISAQLNAIMHDPAFQRLEAAWTGLHDLVQNTETSTDLKLRVLNVNKKELLKDISTASEFDQSALFKKVYEEEYGTFGGSPYSVLIGDYEFDAGSQDIALLQGIASIAAAAHAPFIAAASPSMFFMSSFTELSLPRDLSKIFESTDYIQWNDFRDSPDSRYVALTLPRVLQRLPYGEITEANKNVVPVNGMTFNEDVDGFDHSRYLWGNPAYKLAQRITNAYSLYGWTAAIRGVEGGGKVEGLPVHLFKSLDGDKALTCPTETAITDRREKELNDLGFISLVHCKDTSYAAFFGGQTTQKPKTNWSTEQANANSRTSAMLPYILNASRFAHAIKASMRDKVGRFMSKSEVQTYLNLWIGGYVLGKDDAGMDLKARFPLREARVDVMDVPGQPGCYTATVFLRPHYQLEALTASIRLVAELPAPAAA